MCVHTEKRLSEDGQKTDVCKTRREASGEPDPAGTMFLDFQLPRWGLNVCAPS